MARTELAAEDLVLEILRAANVTEAAHEQLAETGAIERAMRAAVEAASAMLLEARAALDDEQPTPANVISLMGWMEASVDAARGRGVTDQPVGRSMRVCTRPRQLAWRRRPGAQGRPRDR